jgi:hypothetical protein
MVKKMNATTTYSHGFTRRLMIVTIIFLFVAIGVSPVLAATPLSDYHHIFINVANDDGVKFDLDGAKYGGPANTYYIKADGGGVNELHITTDPSNLYGQPTTSTAQSGTFYVTNTGGRGHDEDIILLLSVQAPIPDDFSVHIKSSGYTDWTLVNPNTCGNPPSQPTDYKYVAGAVDTTFTKEDFIYGTQTWKPGPSQQPLYAGQNIADASTNSYLMFVDLKVGNLKQANFPSLIDGGAAKVEFTFTNMDTSAAFNGYGWTLYANQCQGISWTNDLTGASSSGISGYYVTGAPITPAPEFPTMALPAALIIGMLGAVLFIQRTKEN